MTKKKIARQSRKNRGVTFLKYTEESKMRALRFINNNYSTPQS